MKPERRGVWLRVVAEGVAIVVSILLAFGIQAWWERSNQRSTQLSELSAVLEDFRATRTRLEQSLHFHRIVEGAARELGERLDATVTSSPVTVPDTLVIAVLAMPTSELATGDLQQLQLATDISAIHDPELRERLVSFPARIKDILSEEAAGQELVRTRLARSYSESPTSRRAGSPYTDGSLTGHVVGVTPGQLRNEPPFRSPHLQPFAAFWRNEYFTSRRPRTELKLR